MALHEYAVRVVTKHVRTASPDHAAASMRTGGSRARRVGDVPTRAAEILANQKWMRPSQMLYDLAHEYNLRSGIQTDPVRSIVDSAVSLSLEARGAAVELAESVTDTGRRAARRLAGILR